MNSSKKWNFIQLFSPYSWYKRKCLWNIADIFKLACKYLLIILAVFTITQIKNKNEKYDFTYSSQYKYCAIVEYLKEKGKNILCFLWTTT